MDTLLPSNQALLEFDAAVPWREIEQQKRQFNQAIRHYSAQPNGDEPIPLESLSDIVGAAVSTFYPQDDLRGANVFLAHVNGKTHVLGTVVSARYRSGKSYRHSIVPYNLNPSVNHTNIDQTDNPTARMRALGAEIELGLVHKDGESPSEEEMQNYMAAYRRHARKLGITPHLDREACQYQIETHVAPVVGYHNTRQSLVGILTALAASSEETGLLTALMSTYPTESDFKLTDDPKVHTAVDLMVEVNNAFEEYRQRLSEAQERYHVKLPSNVVQMFRIQGCHIHLDLAGRSEALGLLAFYTILRSASAIANAAVLKGGPFVNGTCDPELLCAREYLRRTTVTGRFIEIPTSPHFTLGGMEHYTALLRSERVNSTCRAMLYEDGLGDMVSAMHNGLGRIRPDLITEKRICTLESTGMPANISASRMAAVLTDFEFSHMVIENYFRKYGCDLEPMFNDKVMWAALGPLDAATFRTLHDLSDRECTDIVLTTAAGTQMSLAEFYEMKRIFMHKALADVEEVSPRDIDDVYISMARMLNPPSGRIAQTIEHYVADAKLRSTGNWGRILRDAYVEAGGVVGEHHPEAVLKVVNRIHGAMRKRYLDN